MKSERSFVIYIINEATYEVSDAGKWMWAQNFVYVGVWERPHDSNWQL